jgi:hypothetical protein
MADQPSSILLLRLQSTGSNLNLWGGYLNTALQTQERATKGYQAYTVTGDATISWTNYSATNDLSVAYAKLTGTPTAAFAITLPSVQHFFGSWNGTNYTGTLKNSGGTGIAVPASRRALLYGDASDIGEASPNWLSNYVVTLLNDGDIVVKKTLEQAIANANLPATSGTVLNSVSDTTAGYFTNKITVSGSLTKSTTNVGGNEATNIDFTFDEGQTALMAGIYSL